MEDKKYCVYRHIRLDTNKTFYIGVSTNIRRPYNQYDRSQFWKNIISKSNYEVQILTTNLTKEEACELEIILISYYGRINNKTGILCNMTDGGEGTTNLIVSDKTKILQSEAKKKNPIKYWKGKNLSKKHIENLITNSGMAKKVINIETSEIYSSCRQCALINNFCYSSFAQRLNGIKENNTIFKFLENDK